MPGQNCSMRDGVHAGRAFPHHSQTCLTARPLQCFGPAAVSGYRAPGYPAERCCVKEDTPGHATSRTHHQSVRHAVFGVDAAHFVPDHACHDRRGQLI